jgi:fructan beta-fructosidase
MKMTEKTDFTERYRPQFHFTPEKNWMNDPNGMVYYDGEYHLFYQHYPEGNVWGPMHWGHAVSTDMIHWEHLPIALFPDEHGYIFSGSAVVDANDTTGFFNGGSGLVAIFTHAGAHPITKKPRQAQSLAYSLDKGRTWIKYAGNPVLTDDSIVDFRDPKVFWMKELQKWMMVLAAGDHVRIYSSPDLKSWEFESKFGEKEGSHLGVWECPDLFPLAVDGDELNQRWVLLVSIGDNPECPEGSRTQYFIGDFDGHTFKNINSAEIILWADLGRDNYAGVTWSDIPTSDGRRLLMGWMSNWKYANLVPTNSWRSAMTVPRELTLRDTGKGVRLYQTPAKELEALRRTSLYSLNQSVILTPEQNLLKGVRGKTVEIIAEFELKNTSRFGFKVGKSSEEETVIGFNEADARLYLDRRKSGECEFHPEFACVHDTELKPQNNKIFLQIYVDSSSIEVFANGGELVMTDLIFPSEGSDAIQLFVESGSVWLHNLQIYEYSSVWKER